MKIKFNKKVIREGFIFLLGCVFMLLIYFSWDFFARLSWQDFVKIVTSISAVILFYIQIQRWRLQAKTLILQTENGKIQSFESTFFLMLNLHKDIVNSLEYKPDSREPIKARSCFSKANEMFINHYKKVNEEFNYKGEIEKVNLAYNRFRKQCRETNFHLGHYFNSLNNLIKYVEENTKKNDSLREKKKDYIDIISSQLSTEEGSIVFFRVLANEKEFLEFSYLVRRNNLLNKMWIKTLDEKQWSIFNADELLEELQINYDKQLKKPN
ncbi:putative phage abortive infection protein [Bacillus rhizoplanae]|uniref:putative phage abortive infection protein n=1 Tax=Bacillus rhizoplanae TaxID=2880966 RepID=UPI003D198BFF